MSQSPKPSIKNGVSRRKFLQAGAAGAAGLMTGAAWGQSGALQSSSPSGAAGPSGSRPNIIFLSADELGIEAISGHGCPYVQTPHIDRLVHRGLSFQQSYTSNPLCTPARSSWFTGRMPSETGAVDLGMPIRRDLPTMGNVLRAAGYETFFAGKWHLPDVYSDNIPGFRVLPGGIRAEGNLGDTTVSQACEGLLENRQSSQPFLLVASLLQPHDICEWIADHEVRPTCPWPRGLTEKQLPALPPNFTFDPREPKEIHWRPAWTPSQWRYYLWSYYRHVEMVDAEIGRILDAVEDSPSAGNTLIIFTSDHGEGQARHKRVMKNFLYDEAAKVPLIISWSGRIAQGARDTSHLISCTDLLPTMCDYAGVAPPPRVVGRSLRPLLEGRLTPWRDMIAAEVVRIGRMIRTEQYKYITYAGDPVKQFFDMRHDPWETKNLYYDTKFASAVQDHQKMLDEWESRLDPAPNSKQAHPGDSEQE